MALILPFHNSLVSTSANKKQLNLNTTHMSIQHSGIAVIRVMITALLLNLFSATQVEAQPFVLAKNDTVVLTSPGWFGKLYSNDSIIVSTGYASVTWTDIADDLGISVFDDGSIEVLSEALPGAYVFRYAVEVTDLDNIKISDTGVVFLTIIDADTGLVANNDTFYITAGGDLITLNYLENDTIDGLSGDSIIFGTGILPNGDVIEYNWSGNIYAPGILPGGGRLNMQTIGAKLCTEPGMYVGQYRLQRFYYENSTNTYKYHYSKEANLVIIVENDLVLVQGDTFGVLPGQSTPSIFDNDPVGITDIYGVTDHSFELVDELPESITLNDDGTLTLAADIAPGTYQFRYLATKVCPDTTSIIEEEPDPPFGVTISLVNYKIWYFPDMDLTFRDTALVVIQIDEPLGVDLISFQPTVVEDKVLLNWRTLREENNSYYEVQHSSNGNSWKAIGKVQSKAVNGNSTGIIDYNFTHDTPVAGLNYYRLKQVDIDGVYSFSSIAQIVMQKSTIYIYPNPANEQLHVSGIDKSGQVLVYNLQGQLQMKAKVDRGSASISLAHLPSGTYYLQLLQENGSTTTHKFDITH
jgi:hypothetical protein